MKLAGALKRAVRGRGNQRTGLDARSFVGFLPNAVGTGCRAFDGFVSFFAVELAAQLVETATVPSAGFRRHEIESTALGLALSEGVVPFPVDASGRGGARHVKVVLASNRAPRPVAKAFSVAAEVAVVRRHDTAARFAIFAFWHCRGTPHTIDARQG